jgi:hypothetical protein
MSAQKMEQYLDGRLTHSDINKDDIAAYVAAQKEASSKAVSPESSAPAEDPLGARDVHSESKKLARNPLQAKGRSFAPRSAPPAFTGSDKTAANALRTIIGPTPFYSVPSYGKAHYIPDATLFSEAWMATDKMMANTPKFVDAALNWHPLVSRYYGSVLWYLVVFRSMREAGELPSDLDIFLNDLFKKHPETAWPVPGPVVAHLTSLASSSPLIDNYADISPWLPELAPMTERNYQIPINNLLGRVPLPHVLIGQIHKYNAFLDATTADADVAVWSQFLVDVFGYKMFNDTTDGTDPAAKHPYDSGAFNSVVSANETARRLVCTPFLQKGFHVTTRAVKNYRDNTVELNAMLPKAMRDKRAIGSSAAVSNWPIILGLDTLKHLPSILSTMAVYSRHLSASVCLADIIPVGHTAGQVRVTLSTLIDTRPGTSTITGRFPDAPLSLAATSQNNQLPAADLSDSLIAAVNLSKFQSADASYVSSPVAGVHPLTIAARVSGPYFFKLPVVLRTGEHDPAVGYESVIASEYHSQTPLRSQGPN